MIRLLCYNWYTVVALDGMWYSDEPGRVGIQAVLLHAPNVGLTQPSRSV